MPLPLRGLEFPLCRVRLVHRAKVPGNLVKVRQALRNQQPGQGGAIGVVVSGYGAMICTAPELST